METTVNIHWGISFECHKSVHGFKYDEKRVVNQSIEFVDSRMTVPNTEFHYCHVNGLVRRERMGGFFNDKRGPVGVDLPCDRLGE